MRPYLGKAHVAFSPLLPSHPVGSSPGRGPLPRLTTSAKPTSLLVISYGRTQYVHLPGWASAFPPPIDSAYAAIDRLLLAHAVGSSRRRGELPRFLTSACARRFQ